MGDATIEPREPTPGQRYAATFIRGSVEGSDAQPCVTVEQLDDAGEVGNAMIVGYVPFPWEDVPATLVKFIGANMDRFAAAAVETERARCRALEATHV